MQIISLHVVVGNKNCTTTISVGYGLMRLSPRLLSVSILRDPLPEGTTTVQRVEREIMQHGARIMRWGRLGHQLRQMQSGMMAMHDNVQFMLVKLRLKADMPYVALDMLKEV